MYKKPIITEQMFSEREYIEQKLRLQATCVDRVTQLRWMYGNRDIGAQNFSLHKVTAGKAWFNKSSRRK